MAVPTKVTDVGHALTQAPTVVVHEIYPSIQGESSFAGIPCTFVRLTGCNLRCVWCDTTEAFYGGSRRDVGEVVRDALSHGTPLVEVTGGEPLLQPGCFPLLASLCDSGVTVLLETSGERDIGAVDPRVHRIVDLKAPGSGECDRNRWDNMLCLTQRDEVKFVLSDRVDFDWAVAVTERERLLGRVAHVLLSPVHGLLDPKELVTWVLDVGMNFRVQVQVHKYVWGPDASSV